MQDARERTGRLAAMLVDSRNRTLELVCDLSDEQMIGPQLRIVNPPLREIGHLTWFQERWNLRRITDEEFAPSTALERGDEFYDSMEVAHDVRWDLPLLSREETLSYLQRVLDETLHGCPGYPAGRSPGGQPGAHGGPGAGVRARARWSDGPDPL
jgi:iron(II)-dependent oxidoreductase